MAEFYNLVSSAASPVVLADMKTYLKISSASDDTLIQSLIDVATEYGEIYTGRSFRAQTWQLLLDEFDYRIKLRRSPVDAIVSVKYSLANVMTTIAAATYYLKTLQQFSEILVSDGYDWPTDIDNIEQGIEVNFTTAAYDKAAERIQEAIKLHVAYLYANRGDCDDAAKAASASGASMLYDTFRISRV